VGRFAAAVLLATGFTGFAILVVVALAGI